VNDTHRLDAVAFVGNEPRFDCRGIGAVAPVTGDEFRFQTQALREVLPQRGELTAFIHQHGVTRRQGVDQRRFPGAGTGGRVNDNVSLGLEHAFHAGEYVLAELRELRTAMVDHRHVDGAHHAFGHGAGSGDLQEMAAGGVGHGVLQRQKLSRHGNAGTSAGQTLFCMQNLAAVGQVRV